MNVSRPVLLSIALISLGAGLMMPPLFQVAVTNFPLDEEGNLKVSSQDQDFVAKISETFVLFSEEPLPYPSGLRSPTINVTQYKTIHLLVKTTASIDFIVYFDYIDPQTSKSYEIAIDIYYGHYGERIVTYTVLAPLFHIHVHPQAEGTIEALVYATTP